MAMIIFGKNLLQSNIALTSIINGIIGLIYFATSMLVPIDILIFFIPLGIFLSTSVTFVFSLHFHFRQVFLY